MSLLPDRKDFLRLLAYASAFVTAGLARWVDQAFGEPSIDQILYHLQYADGAAVHMGEIFVITFIAEVLAFPLAFALAAAWLHSRLAHLWPDGRLHVLHAAPAAALVAGVLALLLQFSVFSYAAAHFEPDHFGAHYVNPQQVRLKPTEKRNLILVYVESLEQAYGDASLFGRDLLAPLRAHGGTVFESYRDAPGAAWTIAGMVATQCGLPLKVYSEYDLKRSAGERVFLPGATCLGDLLRAHGYRNVFMGGAPLSFAGKGSFLRDHGYTETWGRDEWAQAGLRPEEHNEWGLYDSALLQRARSRLEQLHATNQPFNLTLLTLDMHNPHGFLSPACRARGARDFEGIVGCTSSELAEFVQFIRDKGWLENTTIVILGDHLAVPNPVWDKLKGSKERRIFNQLLAQPLPRPNTPEVLPFDFFPTTVELLGLKVDGKRLGLGYSAIGEDVAQRPAKRTAPSLAGLNGSASYRALWQATD